MHFATHIKMTHLISYYNSQIKEMITGLHKLGNLRYVTIVSFLGAREHDAKDLAELFYDVDEDLDIEERRINLDATENFEFDPIISIHRHQVSYGEKQIRAFGDHFNIIKRRKVTKFEPTAWSLVQELQFLAAAFGRSLSKFAMNDSGRYQNEGLHDLEAQVGYVEGSGSLVEV